MHAFWEYLLLLEICNACIRNDSPYFGRDHEITAKLPNLRDRYGSDPYILEGDFSERIGKLIDDLEYKTSSLRLIDGYLSREQIADLLYKHDINRLRNDVFDYLHKKTSICILVDNLDKSWESSGVSSDDILMVRSLLESGRKLERSLAREDIQSFVTIFLRNDVYELLLDQTPDRGKEGKVAIDWTDRQVLKKIVRTRMSCVRDGLNWNEIAVPHVDGTGSFDWTLDRSLMRPRYLLDFVNKSLGIASSRGHNRIEESDFREAYGSYSRDVVVSINLEIRDVKPHFYDAIFALLNLQSRTTRIDIGLALIEKGYADSCHDEIIDLLIWYGVLGCVGSQGNTKYIYEVEYNTHVLQQIRSNRGKDNEEFEVNSAFWPALNIDNKGEPNPASRLI